MADLVYVTDGNRHLVCRPYSIENLHAMARELGIKKCWFHRDHYDIPQRQRASIEALCTVVRPRDVLKIIKNAV
jgi:FMN phosphatase YigB (HAD superfamily)